MPPGNRGGSRGGGSRGGGSSSKKETLFHSAFAKMGTVEVTVKSDVLKSNYPNKPDYVVLEIDGKEYYYNTENDACAEFWQGMKGETCTVEALGSREEAYFEVAGEGGGQREERAPQGSGQRSEPRQQQQSSKPQGNQRPEVTQEQALTKAKVLAMKLATLKKVCHLAVEEIGVQWKARYGVAMTQEQYQSDCGSIFIDMARKIVVEDLPVKFDFAGAGKPAPAEEPPKGRGKGKQEPKQLAPEPEPEPEADAHGLPEEDDSVPF